MPNKLDAVRKATALRQLYETTWRESIKDAVKSGESLRKVAEAAGISHVRVLQITRED